MSLNQRFSRTQLEAIETAVISRPRCNLLVFGAGSFDARWSMINRAGFTIFVDEDEKKISDGTASHPSLKFERVDYGDFRVSNSTVPDINRLESRAIPHVLTEYAWDVIIVDGPAGYDSNCIGRALSIYWTSRVANSSTHIFISDADRLLESNYTSSLLQDKRPLHIRIPKMDNLHSGIMRWYVGDNLKSKKITLLDQASKKQPLKYLYRGKNSDIIAFHDSVNALPQLIDHRIVDENTIVCLSNSWYRSPESILDLQKKLYNLEQRSNGRFRLQRNLILMVNSKEETSNLRLSFPGVRVVHVNNTALLSEKDFTITETLRSFEAVFNAKPLVFKRHYLTANIPGKVFITYDASEGFEADKKIVDIEQFGPIDVFKNVPPGDVNDILNCCMVGLMLSAVEGACYASTEYLLCGLPVVSTPSLGGRDDFYNDDTAIIVDPTPEAVADGVRRALDYLGSGRFDPENIRARTISLMSGFRGALGDAISDAAAHFDESFDGRAIIEQCVSQGGKLISHRNFWIRKLEGSE